jgi:hypothetical protein
MIRTKALPLPQTDKSVRAQRTQEGAAWTAPPSRGHVLSASDSASRGRGVLGRRVIHQVTHEHDGGHDE